MKNVFYILLFVTISFAAPAVVMASGSYDNSAQNNAPNKSTYISSDFDIRTLRDEVEKLKDEKYQLAIKRADDAGLKADRLLNYLVGIATIFGLALAGFTFIVGGDIWRMRRTLKLSVSEVQKITKSTKEKRDKLVEQVAEVAKTKEELSSLYASAKDEKIVQQKQIEEKAKAFDNALAAAYGTISNIGALGTSANFISNASGLTGPTGPTGPIMNVGPTDPMYVGSLDPGVRCKHCGRPKDYGLAGPSLSDYLLSDPNYVCDVCRAQGKS